MTKHVQWDLERLRIFLAVVQQGSLTRAAGALGLPQPAISRQVSRLEGECGGRLFHRNGRGVTLTPLGESILPRISSLLQEASELTAQLTDGARLPSGEVRLGALPSLYMVLCVPLFFELRESFPAIKLKIFEGSGGQIDQWLANGFIDLGLPYRYGTMRLAEVDPLVHVSSYVVGAPGSALTAEPTVRFSALHGQPLVLPGAPSGVRLTLDHMAKQAGITLNVAVEADSTQIQKAVTRLGGAYTVLPAHVAFEEVQAGTLQVSKIVEPEFERAIVLGTTTARPASRATRQVARSIREIFDRSDDFWSAHLR
ncbi:LysR family transcriptional regulator [Variovorax sp. J31P179]|uniref:LysR family transcriptional regulator n=1 Tax=Variovorax sp. J31P179 TaxID=3053508 RepID=UPI00257834FB|nr:LysR family transcriptional regulator [Variovorax sp. J31P179]MDM0085383.1 LysR family transcriptional regulator [Variovorax sp. J31P179]